MNSVYTVKCEHSSSSVETFSIECAYFPPECDIGVEYDALFMHPDTLQTQFTAEA